MVTPARATVRSLFDPDPRVGATELLLCPRCQSDQLAYEVESFMDWETGPQREERSVCGDCGWTGQDDELVRVTDERDIRYRLGEEDRP